MPFDSQEKRASAALQRDTGLLNPGDPEYDTKMTEMWGGPPIKWFNLAMQEFPTKYSGEGKTALVTGGTGGIGFYVVKLMARLGFTIVLPARPNMLEEAEGTVQAVKKDVPEANIVVPKTALDLRSFSVITAFAAEVKEMYTHLDVLCLNAGRGGGCEDTREESLDGKEAIMQVNATGHFLLTHELLALLVASGAARIVSQSSGARFFAEPKLVEDIDGSQAHPFQQYCLSKAANALFTRELNQRLEAAGKENVLALVTDPGLASTGVNIQHDLTKSLPIFRDQEITTNTLHDNRGHHAADGALPMVLAAVEPGVGRNDWFTTDGIKSESLEQAAHKQDPTIQRTHDPAKDPLNDINWPVTARTSFWEQAQAMTGATWDFLAAKL